MAHRSVSQAVASFRRTHWGLDGDFDTATMHAPDPRAGAASMLGELIAVTYRTRKLGDPIEGCDYEHHFGVRGRNRPWIAYNDTGLLILGGGYDVEWRGIVR